MDIAIIGAGAMGCLFGGSLTEAGESMRLIDLPGPHLTALQRHGLKLHTDAGDRIVPVQAGTAADFARTVDLAIVFTKGPHTETAMRAAAHLVGPATRVLTVQNGLGNDAAIRRAVPNAAVVTGMTNWPADLLGPGHVSSHGAGVTRIWAEYPDVPAIAAVLDRAGLACKADPDTEVAIWEKVAFNAAMNSVAAVTRLPVGDMADHPSGRALVETIVAECLSVARAKGLSVDAERVGRSVAMAFAEHRAHKPSMLQDVLAGRVTEIENINGAVVEQAQALGLDVPVTRTLRDLVRLIGA